MNEYDFSKLNDKEFEVFCADLLSLRECVKFERFKPGRDGGVDGRYFSPNGEEWILQCKHWVMTPLEKLLKYMGAEKEKVIRLAPVRYFLMVSHSLSRNDKKQLMEALSPFVLTPSDILGREDLNDLLVRFPEVERRHYKLWLASSNVLSYLYNKPVIDRSYFVFQEMMESSKLYVTTANHEAAVEKLENLGVVILTGAAGVGKTTLAEQLILQYACDGYSLVSISDDIKEAEGVLDADSRQIYYFDDFLGRNYLEALSGHEGARIVQFIKRITKNKFKRFVLTSRTTILSQGKILNDIFENQSIDRAEFEITLESLSLMDKARILYSHIWHSGVGADYIDQLYKNKRYRNIVMHPNFNPRLIRFITDSQRLTNVETVDYWSYVQELLKNPTKVWENPFESLIDDCGRALVVLVTLGGRSISQDLLAEAFARYVAGAGGAGLTGKKDFFLNLRHLTGSMLTRSMLEEGSTYIRLFNPSLGDFVINRFSKDIPALRAFFDSLRTSYAIKTLSDMRDNGLVAASAACDIAEHLFEKVRQVGFLGVGAGYVAQLCILRLDLGGMNVSLEKRIMEGATFIIESEPEYDFFASALLVLWALENGCLDGEKVRSFVSACWKRNPSFDELRQLGKIVSHLRSVGDCALDASYDEIVSEYLISDINDDFPEDQVFDYNLDRGSVRRRFDDFVSDRVGELGVFDLSGVCEVVIDNVNVIDKFEEFLIRCDLDEGSGYGGGYRVGVKDTLQDIDDLFYRE